MSNQSKNITSKVISLTDRREKRQGYQREVNISGECKCLNCGHEWTAVSKRARRVHNPEKKNLGQQIILECPKCHIIRGVYKFPFTLPEGTAILMCNCGNDLLQLTPEGRFCPNCGVHVIISEDEL